jgi:hypothetical protein
MVTGTVERVAGTYIVMKDAYCHLNCAAFCVGTFSTLQQLGCGQSLAVCCFELEKHKYRHPCVTLSLLSCGTSHLVLSNILPFQCMCEHTPKGIPTFLSGYVLPVVYVNTKWQSLTYRSAFTVNQEIPPVTNNNYGRKVEQYCITVAKHFFLFFQCS